MIELLIGPVASLLEKLIPDKDAREKMAHDIATLAERQAHEQIMAQAEVNKKEASHRSLFVAGWRPFIGWACGVAMVNNFILVPYMNVFGLDVVPLDLSTMMPVLLGMLGLGGMRSYEKKNGLTK